MKTLSKKPSISKPRTLIAALLASVLGALATVLITVISVEIYSSIVNDNPAESLLASIGRSFQLLFENGLLVVIALIAILPTALLYGLPSHIVLLKTGKWRLWHYLLTGAVMGIPAITAISGRLINQGQSALINIFLGILCGSVSAIIFRLLMGGAVRDAGTASWRPAFAPAPLPAASGSDILSAALISGAMGTLITFGARIVSSLVAGSVPIISSVPGNMRSPFSDEAWIITLLKSFAPSLAILFVISVLLCGLIYKLHNKSSHPSHASYVIKGAIGGGLILIAATLISGPLLFGTSFWRDVEIMTSQTLWACLAGGFSLHVFVRRLKRKLPQP